MAKKFVRVTHRPTDTLLAEAPLGWGITSFEGNLYIRDKYLKTDGFRINFIPGLCFYKFLYVWMNLRVGDETFRSLGWKYWSPSPFSRSSGSGLPCQSTIPKSSSRSTRSLLPKQPDSYQRGGSTSTKRQY